jgi:hypothetical protein
MSQLNLTVTGAEVRDIKNLLQLMAPDALDELTENDRVFDVPEDDKVVVVTLEGNATKGATLVFGSNEFSAVYVDEKAYHGKAYKVSSARGIGIYGGWGIGGPGPTTHVGDLRPGDITLRLAFVLPAEVKQFFIRYPTLAGEAALSF